MNTTDLKNEFYKNHSGITSPELTRDQVSNIVDTMIELISKGLNSPDEEGENKVVLRGFGTLKVVTRKGLTYSVRGKQVTVGERKTVVFKPGTDLARSISDEES